MGQVIRRKVHVDPNTQGQPGQHIGPKDNAVRPESDGSTKQRPRPGDLDPETQHEGVSGPGDSD
jgi:hypothetical protein